MSNSFLALFCRGDDFYRGFRPPWRQPGMADSGRHCCRSRRLCFSAIMTTLRRTAPDTALVLRCGRCCTTDW
jgi:hypothetical protein